MKIGWMLLIVFAGLVQSTFANGKSIEKEVVVNASLAEVWNAWTTNEGARTFFSSRTNINPVLGGQYEIYFKPAQPYGLQGSEGCVVHSMVPMESVAFTWNATPQHEVIRSAGLHTIVYLRFTGLGPQKTRIRFSQQGWGEGPEWEQVYEYFQTAWDVVLGRLKIRFASGPIDWNHPPTPNESLSVKSAS
jgi:uncharacterized protein YndB with AHSA1/START domain